MPSPIAHSAMGYLIYRIARRKPGMLSRKLGPLPLLLVVAGFFSLLPDSDAILGWLAGDMLKFHNNGTHSLLVGLGVALSAALIAGWGNRQRFLFWFGVIFTSYALHVVMDAFTWGTRGVMLFWPMSHSRWDAPIKLFYGVRWSDGLLNPAHLITLLSEALFVALVILFVQWLERRDENRLAPDPRFETGEETVRERASR